MNSRWWSALACLLAVALVAGSTAVSPAALSVLTTADERLERAVLARIEKEKEAQPQILGLSIAFADRGGIRHVQGYGFADRDQGLPVARETMFRWASVSKPLTAVVAMQLAAEGRLDLDADIRTYVPEFPDKGVTVTTRQLLTHQGGIVHYTNGPVVRTPREYDDEHPFKDTILALDTFKDSPLVSEPGKAHNYTTHGYMLLGAVVERAGGKPYADLVRERIIERVGMTTLQPDYQWIDIPHRARGYRIARDSTFPSSDTDVSWKLPGGGWISNAEDMARLGWGMLDASLVDLPTREAMWTPQPLADGTPTTYGLGFAVRRTPRGLEVSHSGSQEKVRTILLILPDAGEDGAVVAVMANVEGVRLDSLTRDLASIFITWRVGH